MATFLYGVCVRSGHKIEGKIKSMLECLAVFVFVNEIKIAINIFFLAAKKDDKLSFFSPGIFSYRLTCPGMHRIERWLL